MIKKLGLIKDEEEKEKFGWKQRMRGIGKLPEYEIPKSTKLKFTADIGLGVGAKAGMGITLPEPTPTIGVSQRMRGIGEPPKDYGFEGITIELKEAQKRLSGLWWGELKTTEDKWKFLKHENWSPELQKADLEVMRLSEQASEMGVNIKDWINYGVYSAFFATMAAGILPILSGLPKNILNNLMYKVEGKTVKGKELLKVLQRVTYPDPRAGFGKPSVFDRKIFDEFVKQGGLRGIGKNLKTGVTITEIEPRFAFGAKLYAGLPADEIVKSLVEAGKVSADMVKGLDPIKVSQVTQQLLNINPALANEFLKAVEKPKVKPLEETISGLPKEDESLLKKIDQGLKYDLRAEIEAGVNISNVVKALKKGEEKILKTKVKALKIDIEEKGKVGLFGEKKTTKWIEDFKKAFGRSPTDKELKEIATEQLIEGYEEIGGKVAPDIKFTHLEKALKEIEEARKPTEKTLEMFAKEEILRVEPKEPKIRISAREKQKDGGQLVDIFLPKSVADKIPKNMEWTSKIKGLPKELDKYTMLFNTGEVQEAKEEVTPKVEFKAPWQMTKKEYLGDTIWIESAKDEHIQSVVGALREGKPVSPEVLADYPELKAEPKPPIKPIPKPEIKPVEKVNPMAFSNDPIAIGRELESYPDDSALLARRAELIFKQHLEGKEIDYPIKIAEQELKLAKTNLVEKFGNNYPEAEKIIKRAELLESKPIKKIEKPEVEPTPKEIRAVFMDKENLETNVKNREYFLGKFGKLFTETKKAEDTLIKQKYNEMQAMLEYEEDEAYRLAVGKDKMRVPETTKTEWMEGLGKTKYMQIFRVDKNLQYPDEIASNLGISENKLREQVIDRIRTMPEEVTLGDAKQALIDEGSSVFLQVSTQMDAYRILLDEIEGGEYSFDTPKNIKRLNAKISSLKRDSKKLMAQYEEKITALQKEGIEKRFEELKKITEAEKKVEIEIGVKKGVKEAITGKKLKGLSPEEYKQGNRLMGQINKIKSQKGLTDKEFVSLKRKYGLSPHLATATKRMTIDQLKAVLKAVERTRPKRIGYEKVITKKTEGKIQSLKDSLIEKYQMTEKAYEDTLKDLGIYKEPAYIDAKHFITEQKGKELIYRLIDESNILRITEPLRIALEENPEIKKLADIIDRRVKSEGERTLRDPLDLNSARSYFQILETISGAPFYNLYQDMMNTHLENRAGLGHLINEFDKYRDIIKDEKELKKVEDWILAKSNLKGRPETPVNITPEEIKMAKKIEGILKDYQARARTEKFLDNLEHPEAMPQYLEYKKEIDKAKDIYESKGYDELVKYMETQKWGVIKSGYDPLQVLSAKVRGYKSKGLSIIFGKSHIKVRKDIEYKEQEKNIITRLLSYKRQMDNLSTMAPKVRALITLANKNLDKFKNPDRVRSNLGMFFRELKGYDRSTGWFERGINRLYSQAMITIIMGSPPLAFRNLGQNFGLGHDKAMLVDPRNKKLTPDQIDYLDTYVQQAEFMRVDWFMTGEKPLGFRIGKIQIGLERLTNLIKKINLYPRSDIANRHWGFWGKINQVRMAFEDKTISLKKRTEKAKFSDFSLLEQKRALQILAKDGQGAMEKYVSKCYVDDVHFLYERAQRSLAEMGPYGKVFGNLMLFPRAYWEKLAKMSKKMTGKYVPAGERARAFKVIASILIGGALVGVAYTKTTGRRKPPYDPLVLLAYQTGGLMIGTVEALNDVYVETINAVRGDRRALAGLTSSIPALADHLIPFYNYMLRGYEAFLGDPLVNKNIDTYALKKLRQLIDKEYKIRGGVHSVERDALEKWQYFLGGAGVDVAIAERKKREREAEPIIIGKPKIPRLSIPKIGKPGIKKISLVGKF